MTLIEINSLSKEQIMTKFETFLKVSDYKLTEAGKFGWTCWPNAWTYISSNDFGRVEGVIDPLNDVVYEVTVHSHKDERPYRWQNPQFITEFKSECSSRRLNQNEAWEGVSYSDTECFEDILNKAFAIFRGLNFDERLVISLDVNSAELLKLALAAHESQLSLNDFIIQVVKDAAVEIV